jgi:hypothetical protein
MTNKTLATWTTITGILTWVFICASTSGLDSSWIGLAFIAFTVFALISAHRLNKN